MDYVEGRISTSIGQAERSVPDDVKRKRENAMAVAERERVAKRDREEAIQGEKAMAVAERERVAKGDRKEAIQGERDHQKYVERSV